jgi:hypothetical protein
VPGRWLERSGLVGGEEVDLDEGLRALLDAEDAPGSTASDAPEEDAGPDPGGPGGQGPERPDGAGGTGPGGPS